MKKVKFTFVLILLLAATGYAQELTDDHTFDLSMQFRPRAEYRNGAFRPLLKDESPAGLVSNRLRLNIDYKYSDLLQSKVSLQNVSLWGQPAPIQGINQAGSFAIFEGWADLKIYNKFRTKIGRQTIVLDDQRLFSEANWVQGGRTHDALSVYYASEKFEVRSFFAFNQNYNVMYGGNLNNPSGSLYSTKDAQPYKYMQTLWMQLQLSKSSKASVLFTNLGFQNILPNLPPSERTLSNMQTTGIYYQMDKHPAGLLLSGYYQFGQNESGHTVSAYLLSAGINWKILPNLSLGIRSDYLSGNSINSPETAHHSFSTLFGTGHPFYGQMDYYPSGDAGLWNNVIRAQFSFPKKITLKVSGHFFSSAARFEKSGVHYKKDLGQETDLNLQYKINSFIDLNAGYSIYFTTKNLRALKNAKEAKPRQDWAWVSLNIYPNILKVKF